ncbi:hypothetical protein EV186_1021103 [Labedaea rhizosphaerae]|uniref:Uncharacterized protein n=2 Tax=Labedaea rhizosphaerae TaxID=598644 RepID=A0A4R6SHF4_LABRH|nr:hypothetical protein EV186_1021103 [Labedaea rhizosphaerae]
MLAQFWRVEHFAAHCNLSGQHCTWSCALCIRDGDGVLPRAVTIGLTVLISAVWAFNVVIGFIEPDRRDPTVNAIFAIVVGGIYALGRKDDAVRSARKKLGKLISGDDEPRPNPSDKADP